jgi:uncharacterized integral membrane protein
MNKFFSFLADALNGAERSILDFLSAFVPYAVPVIPAYLTYYHTRDMMDFPAWVALTAAFVVETLGMASVSTAIKFYRNNQRYKSEQNKAPFMLALAVYLFYLLIVLSVNVILEVVAGTRGGWIILSIGLFTLLSVPSGVLISIRAQYREMLDEREETRKPKQQTKHEPPAFGFVQKKRYASDYREKILVMLNDEYAKNNRVLSPKEITAKLNLEHGTNKGFVSTLTKQWKSENSVL